ncbi:MAG TPA: family 16 glycosylhydrolase [Streptosporangiaceae bacterium]|nr:family 16 glycosylhydrolase [Streptosporangiaceae bacterium]
MTRSPWRRAHRLAFAAAVAAGLAAVTALAAAVMPAGGAGAGQAGHDRHAGQAPAAARAPALSRLLAGALALSWAHAGPQGGAGPAAGVPAPPPGWSTVFADGFNGPAGSPPSSSWRYVTGPAVRFGNGEVETLTGSTSNGYLDGRGDLDITAREHGRQWTSARIQTATPDIGAPPGGELEVVASIKQPGPAGGLGYWPAFWMLGPGQWPEHGEIDIMEDVNALAEHSGTLHCGVRDEGPCRETFGLVSGLLPCPGCQAGYHTYAVIIDRADAADESVTWYLDGHQFYRVTEDQVGTGPWRAAVDHGFWIILDLAVGGAYPDGVCACTTPVAATTPGATMGVAYVAAYRTG